jgi:hypothetical protein
MFRRNVGFSELQGVIIPEIRTLQSHFREHLKSDVNGSFLATHPPLSLTHSLMELSPS